MKKIILILSVVLLVGCRTYIDDDYYRAIYETEIINVEKQDSNGDGVDNISIVSYTVENTNGIYSDNIRTSITFHFQNHKQSATFYDVDFLENEKRQYEKSIDTGAHVIVDIKSYSM